MVRQTLLGLLAFAGIVTFGAVFLVATHGSLPSPCEQHGINLLEWPGCRPQR